MIAISIISHGHGAMVDNLINQLDACDEVKLIIVTLNIPQKIAPSRTNKLLVISNKARCGFSVNHNSAFQHCNQPYFCILNPDIALESNPFSALLSIMAQQKDIALVSPRIISPFGSIEDNARYFPTLKLLAMKAITGMRGTYQPKQGQGVLYPDWIAGMFMLFDSSSFSALRGFDENYYLYYEDVDICARALSNKMRVAVDLKTSAIHDAQRKSRKNLYHMWLHLNSMIRYLWKYRAR